MRLEQCLQDGRFGARILLNAPGLSAAAIVLVALVIGGNATVYSTVNSILVSPASGVSRDDLVVIRHVDPGVTVRSRLARFYLGRRLLSARSERFARQRY